MARGRRVAARPVAGPCPVIRLRSNPIRKWLASGTANAHRLLAGDTATGGMAMRRAYMTAAMAATAALMLTLTPPAFARGGGGGGGGHGGGGAMMGGMSMSHGSMSR